ncbi:MAG: CoA transferase [Betaproteobacteria bacterium]|nr:CoA transferase [Betaproteobacteria bacterium]
MRPPLVLSLSRDSVPCEFATRLAVDAGFDVVKAEPPGGDVLRERRGLLASFLLAGKRSVTYGSDTPDDEEFARLAARCEAIVTDEWGHAHAAALTARGNGGRATPPLIVVGERDSSALQGMSAQHSDEFLAFHGSGLGYLTPRVMPGYPSAGPLCPDANLLEFLSGLYGAIALFSLLAAPDGRRHQSATTGLCAAALPLLRREIAAVLYEDAAPHRAERIWKVSPAEVHRCRDGWLFVDVIEDIQWLRLCEYMDMPELGKDPSYTTREQRFAHAETICALLDQFFANRPQSCWIEAQSRGIPIAPVNSLEDLAADAQLGARGFWSTLVTAEGQTLRTPTTPLERLFGTPDKPLRVPRVGQHSAEVVAQLDAP